MNSDHQPQLPRRLGLVETTSVAVGAMIGAGVYVSMGETAGTTGGSMLLAVLIGAAVATLNGLSSAELAVDDPRAGGAYQFASRLVSPVTGFIAGWLFLFGGLLNAAGVRPSVRANIILVLINGGVLVAFTILTLPLFDGRHLQPFFSGDLRGLAQASALLFFAYSGYARPVTIAEEVKDPEATLPKAVVGAIALVTVLYFGVAAGALGVVGPARLGEADAPLRAAAAPRGDPAMLLMSIGALIATSTVLLTEIWGLSRLAFAMARQGDLPRWFAVVEERKGIPRNAVLSAAGLLLLLAALLDLRPALEASSLALLGYYAIMNLSALRLPRERRLYPAAVSAAGLVATLTLAFTMPWPTLLTVIGVTALGLGFFTLRRKRVI